LANLPLSGTCFLLPFLVFHKLSLLLWLWQDAEWSMFLLWCTLFKWNLQEFNVTWSKFTTSVAIFQGISRAWVLAAFGVASLDQNLLCQTSTHHSLPLSWTM
jgi:hypothetical protein